MINEYQAQVYSLGILTELPEFSGYPPTHQDEHHFHQSASPFVLSQSEAHLRGNFRGTTVSEPTYEHPGVA